MNGGHESGQVPDHPPAQCGYAAGAVNACPHQFGTQLFRLLHAFGRFSRIHDVQAGHEARAFQGFPHALRVQRGHVRVRDNRYFAVQPRTVGKLPYAVQSAVFHMNIIRTLSKS